MIVTGTTDSINFALSATTDTTFPVNYFSSYNVVSSSNITPSHVYGNSDGGQTIKLVPSPSSGKIHQLKSCFIFNGDTSPVTANCSYVIGSTSYTVFCSTIGVNESACYTQNFGWQLFDNEGKIKMLGMYDGPNSLRFPPAIKPTGVTTTTTLTSNVTYAVYAGRADRSYSTIKVIYNVTSAVSPTTAQIGIYTGKISIASGTTYIYPNCGYANATFNSTGIKTATISTIGAMNQGDDIFIAFYAQYASGTLSLRSGIFDDLAAGYIGTGSTGSISSNNFYNITNTSTINIPWICWQPLQ